MITLKSAREIEAMDRAGDFLASIHIGLRDLLKPGVDMWEVEEYVRRRCKEENVLPLQIGVEGSIMDYPLILLIWVKPYWMELRLLLIHLRTIMSYF